MTEFTRRNLLKAGLATGFAAGSGALGALTSQQAFAASTNGYKALVAVFLNGGMDQFDTVLPYDAASHSLLKNHRAGILSSYAASGNSREQSGMLALTPDNQANFGSRRFALPPEMQDMKLMFDAGEMAIVGNVGPLIEPINRDSMKSGQARAPKHLFSHNDQQSTWMTLGSEGQRIGWAGKFADTVLRSNSGLDPRYIAVTSGTNDVFLSGEVVSPFSAFSGGSPTVDLIEREYLIGSQASYDPVRNKIRSFLEDEGAYEDRIYQRDFAARRSAGLLGSRAYNNALAASPSLTTSFPTTNLGKQLEAVAQTINIRSAIGATRQIFYVSMGGFDTHAGQTGSLPALQAQLSSALSAFRTAMVSIGAWNNVTLFTMSDFGRTLIDNGNGTDHGWGSHHFVMGGSVKGRKIYGDVPAADLSNPVFTEKRGRLIPTTSVEQYAATFGQWFGLDAGEISRILPNLSNFSTKNIGFL